LILNNGSDYHVHEWLNSGIDGTENANQGDLEGSAKKVTSVEADNADLNRSPEALLRKSMNPNTGGKIVRHIRGGSKSYKSNPRFQSMGFQAPNNQKVNLQTENANKIPENF